ncbi:hypothetical protein BH09PSE2_BH09PSE2_13000 [soil metagenome]
MLRPLLSAAAVLVLATPAAAQMQTPAERLSAEREAMKPLAWMDGRWEGPAYRVDRGGRHEMTQTERIGPFLDGAVKVLEGKSLGPDRRPAGFNAFGTISFDPEAKAYTLHSYAQGYAGDFPLTVTPDGYVWEVPAGPTTKMRYTAVFKAGTWVETGVITGPDAPSGEVFRMTLTRLGDTDWPAAGGAGSR